MKKTIVFAFSMLCALVLMQCTDTNTMAADETATPAPTHQDTVKRGEYLVTIMGCEDCHSPKRMGPNGPEIIPERRLSGFDASHPLELPNLEAMKQGWVLMYPDFTSFVGPWGVSFTANLTSDETGIGNWSLEQFKRAIKEGKYKGLETGRPLLPPMPWFNLTNITDEDAAAIFAFLKSTNPVRNVPPPPIPPDQM